MGIGSLNNYRITVQKGACAHDPWHSLWQGEVHKVALSSIDNELSMYALCQFLG